MSLHIHVHTHAYTYTPTFRHIWIHMHICMQAIYIHKTFSLTNYTENFRNMEVREGAGEMAQWRRVLAALAQGPGFSSQETIYNLQSPTILVPEDPAFSSGLCGPQIHVWHIYTHTGKQTQTPTHNIYVIKYVIYNKSIEIILSQKTLSRRDGNL